MLGKSRITMFFQCFVVPEGRKVGSLKRRVRSHVARGEMRNCTPLWREARFQVKMYKRHQLRTTFGSWDVEKSHAAVVRSAFVIQNAQGTPGSDHFWKFRCGKMRRHCGAKHICKSKCTKHHSPTTFCSSDVEKWHAAVAQSAFAIQHVKKLTVSGHFWKVGCQKITSRRLVS